MKAKDINIDVVEILVRAMCEKKGTEFHSLNIVDITPVNDIVVTYFVTGGDRGIKDVHLILLDDYNRELRNHKIKTIVDD